MDQIGEAIKQAAAAAIVPRFRALAADDVIEKSPGDVVTTADRECEQLLVDALSDIAPGIPVLGEEAAAANPDATKSLLAQSSLFVVDPLDGTRAFVGGSPDFAVMVARVEAGETTQSWIWHPMHNVMWTAQLAGGAWCNGVRQTRAAASDDAVKLRGIVKVGFLDATTRGQLTARFDRFAEVTPGPPSAGFAYPELVTGAVDFLMFWRTLPWDHAPGVLLAQEAGCTVKRLDGSLYRADQEEHGLLSAAGPAAWRATQVGLWP